jgi:hypothetical protein
MDFGKFLLETAADALSGETVDDALLTEMCERSFLSFIETFWPFVEPSTPFVSGWAIEAICDHLEAVSNGEITRLLINVPPGFMKSMSTNVFWPAFEWGPLNKPATRYVTAAYASALTERDNVRFRQVISSPLYRKLWGHRFAPSKEQFNIVQVANDRTGWKLASSVTGVGTGARGDRVLIDDPNSVKDAESDVVRQSTNQWFTEVVPTRLSSPEKSAIIVIQQRTHEDDVSGIIIQKELEYDHLMIPMEYDPARHCTTSIGWQDPRGTYDDEDGFADPYGDPLPENERYEQLGVLAFPERFPLTVVERDKRIMGPYASAGQFQQSPSPRGGGIFKEEWWRIWPPEEMAPPPPGKQRAMPPFDYIVASLDSGYTEKEENDPSALVILGVFKPTGLARTAPRLVTSGDEIMRMEVDSSTKVMLIHAWEKHVQFRGPPEERPAGITDKEWTSPAMLAQRQVNWGLVEWVVHTCRKYEVDHLLIESKASGITVAQEMRTQFQNENFGIETIDPSRMGDKVARAHAVVHLFSNGRVYAPQIFIHEENRWDWPTWARLVIDRMRVFPKGSRKDIVDAMTQALRHLRDTGMAPRSEEEEHDLEQLNSAYQPKSRPLYDV